MWNALTKAADKDNTIVADVVVGRYSKVPRRRGRYSKVYSMADDDSSERAKEQA